MLDHVGVVLVVLLAMGVVTWLRWHRESKRKSSRGMHL